MMDIKWEKKFEVGHPRIDHEHQVFVELIRSVSLEAERDCSRERIARLLLKVKKYAEFHFISEENIMLDVAYPDFEHHKSEHEMLLFQLDDKLHRFRAGEIELDAIAEFMFTWFALHTTQVDKRIAEFIVKHDAGGVPSANIGHGA